MMAVKMNADETDEELIRMAFRVLDKKGSGNISSKEFKLLMTNIGDKLSELEVTYTSFRSLIKPSLCFVLLQFQTLIQEADKDGDGQLDYEEFVQLMTNPATAQHQPTTSTNNRRNHN